LLYPTSCVSHTRAVLSHTRHAFSAPTLLRIFLFAHSSPPATYTLSLHDALPILLAGDSAANVVLGRDTTLSITVDEMIVLAKAVSLAARRALVVVDLPFGSYEASP